MQLLLLPAARRGMARAMPPHLLTRMQCGVDAVLLDWEGVLADCAGVRRDALAHALAAERITPDAPSLTRHPADPAPGIEASTLANLDRTDPALADLVRLRASRAFAERLAKGFVLMPGARAFVEHAQLVSRVAIVTSATRSETEFVLRLSGLDGAVATIVSADDGLAPPPLPAMYERALEQLSRRGPIHRECVVAIGQASDALRAARACGVRTVALGAPAHVAVEADGAIDTVHGLLVTDLARLAGVATAERRP